MQTHQPDDKGNPVNWLIVISCVECFLRRYFLQRYSGRRKLRGNRRLRTDVIENRKPFGKKLMWISFMGFAVITLYYGPLIYRSAQAYEGRLSWYIDEAKHKRSVTELLFLSGL